MNFISLFLCVSALNEVASVSNVTTTPRQNEQIESQVFVNGQLESGKVLKFESNGLTLDLKNNPVASEASLCGQTTNGHENQTSDCKNLSQDLLEPISSLLNRQGIFVVLRKKSFTKNDQNSSQAADEVSVQNNGSQSFKTTAPAPTSTAQPMFVHDFHKDFFNTEQLVVVPKLPSHLEPSELHITATMPPTTTEVVYVHRISDVPYQRRLSVSLEDYTEGQSLLRQDQSSLVSLLNTFKIPLGAQKAQFVAKLEFQPPTQSHCVEETQLMTTPRFKPATNHTTTTWCRSTSPSLTSNKPYTDVTPELPSTQAFMKVGHNSGSSQFLAKIFMCFPDMTNSRDGLNKYNPKYPLDDYVAYLNKESSKAHDKYQTALWNNWMKDNVDTRQGVTDAWIRLLKFKRALKKEIDPLIKVNIIDESVKRQLTLLRTAGIRNVDETDIKTAQLALTGLRVLFSETKIKKFNNSDGEKFKLHPCILHIMATSRNPDELLYYWFNWRNTTGPRVKNYFNSYITLLNKSAVANGLPHAGVDWSQNYECEGIMNLIVRLMDDIAPLYKQLHAYVRHKLRSVYGKCIVTGDKIPVHITGDMWGENWGNIYSLTQPFPPNFCQSRFVNLTSKGYSVTQMANDAELFYHSLGFPEKSGDFWRNSVLVKRHPDMKCEPSAWDFSKESRIAMCARIDFPSYFTLHHELAHIHYFQQYQNQPFAFRDGPNPAFHEAIADAILLSVKSKTHLRNMDLLKYGENFEDNINTLFKMALEQIAFLPFSFVLGVWRYQLFAGKITPCNANSMWWQMRKRYQGVVPPCPRCATDLDPATKFHIAINKANLNYFLSTIMAFQFHEALCKISKIQQDLHLCDITSSVPAGQVLREVMSKGASEHWKNQMFRLTGEREIKADGLLNYFKPLMKWLHEENLRLNESVGWYDD